MSNQPTADASLAVRRHLALFLTLVFVVASAFLLLSDLNQQPKARLDELIDGTAPRPYVSRRLVPQLLGVAAPTSDETTLSEAISRLPVVSMLLDWLALPDDYGLVLLAFGVLNYLFLLGFVIAFHRLATTLAVPHPGRLSALSLLLLLLPVFLSHGYIYDYATLFLWTLLLLMLAKQRWLLSLIVVAAAAINKETALLIPLIWLTYGRTLGRPRLYWGMLAAQGAIVTLVWAAIAWVFRNNDGGLFEFNLPVHLTAYQAAPAPIVAVVAGVIAVVTIAYPLAPPLLRSSAILLLPLSGLYLFFGWPYEFRVFYEVYPMLMMLAAFAVQRIATSQAINRWRDDETPPEFIEMNESVEQRNGHRPRMGRSHRILLIAVVLLAFFLRVWQLDALPPGVLLDEVYNGLDAQRVVSDQVLPLFFETNYGREPLLIYLQALAVWLWGMSAYSLRLVAAMAGVTTVAVVFVMARALLADMIKGMPGGFVTRHTERATAFITSLALVSAAGIAVSFWHVGLSRLGLQAVLTPCFGSIAVYFFWRAWRRGNTGAWLLAGVWTGLTLYTDATARFFPLIFVGFLILELLFRAEWLSVHEVRRQRVAGLGLMAATALLMLIPMAFTMVQSPWLLTGNAAETSVFTATYTAMPGTPRERLGQNLDSIIDAFYFAGDANVRHNLPGRPLHDPIWVILFTAGLATAVWWMKISPNRLTVVWLVLMTLPAWLTVNAPGYPRLIGSAPPVSVLYGLGAGLLMALLPRRRITGVALAALLLFSALLTFYDYFVRWPQTPNFLDAFEQNQYWVARRVQQQLDAGDDQAILLSERLIHSPAFRLLVGSIQYQQEGANSVEHGSTVGVMPGVFFIEDRSGPNEDFFLIRQQQGIRTLQRYEQVDVEGRSILALLRAQERNLLPAADGAHPPDILTGELPSIEWAPAQIPYPLAIQFDNGLELMGYRPALEPAFCPPVGTSVPLVTYWRRTSSGFDAVRGAAAFAHLMLPGRQVQANGELGNGYPAELWRPNEVVTDLRTFSIPAGGASGKAFIEMGLYERTLDGAYQRRHLLDGNGNPAGDQVVLNPGFFCDDIPVISTDDFQSMNIRFEEQIELVGLSIDAPDDGAAQLRVRLVWRTLDWMRTDYVAFVHLIDEQDQIVSQLDLPPGGVYNPTSLWAPGEMVLSQFDLMLPQESNLSKRRLRIGLYEPVSGRQMTITSPDENQHQTFFVFPVR